MSAADRGRLAALIDDAAVELELLASRVRPDFADVVARAQRLDPTRELAKHLDEARGLDDLRGDQLAAVARIGDLDELLASTHAILAEAGAANERAGVPPIRPAAPVRRGRGTVAAVVLGLAAIVVAALALGWGLRARTLDRTQSREYSGANKVAGGDEWSQARIDDAPRRAPKPAVRPPVATPRTLAPVRVPPPPAPA
ncbi:MAG TPA: hypothetical protein VFG69_00490, partial [Nannocystaceae bacterium]|nr:hypothetical protein [Nannocystaceae bacterium]